VHALGAVLRLTALAEGRVAVAVDHYKPDEGAVPTPAGPAFELKLRRAHWADSDTRASAEKQPRSKAKPASKGVFDAGMDGTGARIHLDNQDYSKLAARRFKGTGRAAKRRRVDKAEAADG
jgi:hypothetical protein